MMKTNFHSLVGRLCIHPFPSHSAWAASLALVSHHRTRVIGFPHCANAAVSQRRFCFTVPPSSPLGVGGNTPASKNDTADEVDPDTKLLLSKLRYRLSTDATFRSSLATHLQNTERMEKMTSSSSEHHNIDTLTTVPPPPTYSQLWRLAIRAGLPFFGFGLCDNIIMITVGDAIDATFGVTLGFSTMVAAGLGQAVSDGCGISIQGAIENTADRLGLPNPNLTAAQSEMKSTRLWIQLFRTVGIVLGCLVGVLFVCIGDNGNRPRLIDSIFHSLPPEAKKELFNKRAYKVFCKGDFILRYGEGAPGVYLIITGQAEIYGRDSMGKQMHIHTHQPGDAAGVVEIAFGHPCVADVVASTATVRTMFISTEDLMTAVNFGVSSNSSDDGAALPHSRMEAIQADVLRFVAEDDNFVPYRLQRNISI